MKTTPLAPSVRHRVRLLVGIIALVALTLPAVPAKAVYNGILDGSDRYSNVGFVFTERTNKHDDVTGGGPQDVMGEDHCSGVLIAPTLVLTASLCVNEPWDDYAYFSPVPDFDPLYDYGATDDDGNQLPFLGDLRPYEGGDICDPDTCFRGEVIKASSSRVGGHGLALLKLDVNLQTTLGLQPAKLPAYNSLNDMLGEKVTIVGYGHVNCAGDDCPPDDDAFFDDNQNEFPIWDRFENSVIYDLEHDPPAWWRHIDLTERRYAVMEVIPESGDWPKNGNKYLELSQTEHKYSCIDAGGPYFLGENDPDGTLVAINWDFDCTPVTDVLRLDTPSVRNFLCSKEFGVQATQLLCGGSGSAALSASASGGDGGMQAADRPQPGKHKHKKGGKHRGKGNRGH